MCAHGSPRKWKWIKFLLKQAQIQIWKIKFTKVIHCWQEIIVFICQLIKYLYNNMHHNLRNYKYLSAFIFSSSTIVFNHSFGLLQYCMTWSIYMTYIFSSPCLSLIISYKYSIHSWSFSNNIAFYIIFNYGY